METNAPWSVAGGEAPFDYDQLDAATRAVVEARRDEIRSRARHLAGGVIEIGRSLIDVKARLPHGQFACWLAAEFSWTDRTARKYMRIAEVFGETEVASVLGTEALDALASESTPEEVRDAFLARAEAGQSARRRDVRQAVAAIRQPEPEPIRRVFDGDEEVEEVEEVDLRLRVTTTHHKIAAVRYVPDPDRRAERLADHAAAAARDARDTGKIIDVTGYLRSEAPAVAGVAEEEAPPISAPRTGRASTASSGSTTPTAWGGPRTRGSGGR